MTRAEIPIGEQIADCRQLGLDAGDEPRRGFVIVIERDSLFERAAHHREAASADRRSASSQRMGDRAETGAVARGERLGHCLYTPRRIIHEDVDELVDGFRRGSSHLGEHTRIEPAFQLGLHD